VQTSTIEFLSQGQDCGGSNHWGPESCTHLSSPSTIPAFQGTRLEAEPLDCVCDKDTVLKRDLEFSVPKQPPWRMSTVENNKVPNLPSSRVPDVAP
jgi:hypothetical protein